MLLCLWNGRVSLGRMLGRIGAANFTSQYFLQVILNKNPSLWSSNPIASILDLRITLKSWKLLRTEFPPMRVQFLSFLQPPWFWNTIMNFFFFFKIFFSQEQQVNKKARTTRQAPQPRSWWDSEASVPSPPFWAQQGAGSHGGCALLPILQGTSEWSGFGSGSVPHPLDGVLWGLSFRASHHTPVKTMYIKIRVFSWVQRTEDG